MMRYNRNRVGYTAVYNIMCSKHNWQYHYVADFSILFSVYIRYNKTVAVSHTLSKVVPTQIRRVI